MKASRRRIGRTVLSAVWSFLLFFGIAAFTVTCSFLLFFSKIELTEEEIRTFAPIVFGNVVFLSLLLLAADIVRRKITVDRPVGQIQNTLKRLKNGDFSARVKYSQITSREGRFDEIAEAINLLADELAGTETFRSDFIANVSHELKTPLAVMQNYATLLTAPNISQDERVEYADAICETARRLSGMVTNILKLNRLENQQIFPQAKSFDLGEQLCDALLQFEHIWEKKNIEIETTIAEDVVIEADAELLSLIWSNLLSNAFKFTPEGGRVSLSLSREGSIATVRVSDTGCGMSPEVGAHIFEKFYQGDPSHATAGNGLGLALVRRVTDIVGGEIAVESVVGAGSTFTVRLECRQ